MKTFYEMRSELNEARNSPHVIAIIDGQLDFDGIYTNLALAKEADKMRDAKGEDTEIVEVDVVSKANLNRTGVKYYIVVVQEMDLEVYGVFKSQREAQKWSDSKVDNGEVYEVVLY